MSHQETYRHNEAYAQVLAGWDAAFYAKYADTLKPSEPGARVLDVGCGVGQVVARLAEAGFEAHGVDVSEPAEVFACYADPPSASVWRVIGSIFQAASRHCTSCSASVRTCGSKIMLA